MARPIKYPFASLPVGGFAVVHEVPSRQSVYTAMARFRDSCARDGWPEDAMPQFDLEWKAHGAQAVGITRLPDGRTGRWAATAKDLEVQAIAAAEEAWIAANVGRIRAGEPRQSCPPHLMDRALLCDARYGTNRAKSLALLDSTSIEDLLANPHPRRRQDDEPKLSSYDEARDAGFALRLRAACNSKQPAS